MLKVTKFRQFYFPELNFNINGLVKLQTKTCWSANKTVANILPETRNKNAKMLWSYTFAFAVIDFNRTKIMKIMSRYLTTSLFLSHKIITVQNNSKCKLCELLSPVWNRIDYLETIYFVRMPKLKSCYTFYLKVAKLPCPHW